MNIERIIKFAWENISISHFMHRCGSNARILSIQSGRLMFKFSETRMDLQKEVKFLKMWKMF